MVDTLQDIGIVVGAALTIILFLSLPVIRRVVGWVWRQNVGRPLAKWATSEVKEIVTDTITEVVNGKIDTLSATTRDLCAVLNAHGDKLDEHLVLSAEQHAAILHMHRDTNELIEAHAAEDRAAFTDVTRRQDTLDEHVQSLQFSAVPTTGDAP